MEFVGKTVKKVFKRFGLFKGLVKSYDPSSGFYKIVYEDGDSEELDSSEVATLMDTKESDHKRRVKRRRRFSEMEAGNSNFPETLNSANTLVEVFDRDVDGSEGFDGNLRRINVDLNESLAKGIDHLRDNLCFKESIDLNQGFDLNLNEGFDFKDDDCLNGREYIDLNLDVNDHVDQELRAVDSNENGFETQKTECGFDLNWGIDEDFKDGLDGDRGVQGNESASCELVDEETRRIEEAIANGRLEEVHVLYDASAGLASEACREDIVSGKDFRVSVSVEVLDLFAGKEDQSEIIDANQADLRIEIDKANGSRRRGRRKLVDRPETKSANDFGYENKCTTTAEEQSCMGSAYKEVSGSYGKRRKVMGSARVMGSASSRSETMVLRRSSRRGPIKNDVYSRETTSIDNDPTVTPEASELTEEKADKVQSKSLKEFDLPVKVQLPLSSKNLDLDGIPIFDLFAVYSCLRSFSTVLFLSPFELEDFVASLKCNFPTYLLDSVHVSILQTLRKHLEYLSDEGSESASDCLRSLDWGLLDLITWPIFMVEYILIHLPYLKPSFDVSSLKLLKADYHKQAASIKVEILRCLCDAMMEVEVIRFELNRRSFGAEADIDFDMNVSIRSNRKRRVSVDVRNNSCLTEDTAESFCDWNSDECCLCKMDGILICCDGCPAAYHSKCVGVANDLLPEGDWYCPECVVDRNNPWMKSLKSVRGAELLGIDPYGRRYFCSCGYLLVFDSCENKNAFNFYHTDNLDDVIEVLKSSEVLYGDILDTICKQWKIPGCLHRKDGNLDFQICNSSVAACVPTSGLVASVKYGVQNEILDESEPKEKIAGSSDHLNAELSKSVSAPYMSSEETVETIVASTELNTQIEGQDHCNKSAERPVKPLTDHSLSNTLDVIQENNITAAAIADTSLSVKAEGINRMHAQAGNGYNNYYGFGRTAFAVVEELLNKSSARASEQSLKTEEEIISTQLKAISKKYLKFEWPNFMSYNAAAQKEKCGWCFPCRAPTDDSKCLFHADLGHLQKGCLNDIIGLQSKRNNRGHLVDVASYVLMIEHRLQGLLLGPWIKPHHTRLWRKNILKASDISSVKRLLLELELSMHHLALSPEWFNPLDATTTMGSATHVITAFSRASSKNATGRKKSRHSELEASPLSNSSGGLGMLWWRGGRLSRKIFSWKVLPHSSVSKAARQAGCTKIPGIFYSENSDFAKRIKYIIWRAAVEESTTAEQLALQVRELDAHIKWDEIENTCRLSILDKGLKKSARLFKKVIVRRKSTDGVGAKYLLDFGKRKAIPEVVLKRGLRVEESSSERKKYWLNESYVPLYLLKSFEEKRIVRKSSKINSVELSEVGVAPKRSLKNTGFDYLFAKAERSEHYQCGHCNKNVPIREAVGCQYCQGFFHKRHVKKSCNSVIADCTYTCHRCLNGKYVQVDKKVGRRGPGRGKNGVRIGGPGRGKIGVRVGGPGRGKKGVRIGGPGRGKKGVRVGRPGRENSGVSTGKSTTKIVNGPHIKTKRETAQRISMQLSKGRKSLRISRPQQSKRNEEVSAVMPLRRSSRKAQQSLPLTEKVEPLQKRKQEKLGKDTPKIAKECISWRKKRTQVYQSYWLNGLQLSLKPNDDRAIHFKRKCFLAPNESTIPDRPKCQLCCEVGYQSTSSYISCEICGEWFHGDAFGIKVDSISKLIGFRCHICRKASPPVCQNMPVAEGHVSESKHDDVEQDLPCVNENTETRVSELGDAIGIVDLSQSHKGIAKQPKAPNTRKRRLRGSATELDAVAINTVDTDRGQEEVLKESEGPITRRRLLRGSYSYTHLKGAQ